ncbi:hypothetical protein C2W62_44765, partial [Candidatus Entotheonella serta]
MESKPVDVTPVSSANPEPASTLPARAPVTEHKTGGLGQVSATAICGNDITSSCLYVSALAIMQAGKLAPLA